MNPALIRYQDIGVAPVAAITFDMAKHFATTYDLDMVEETSSIKIQRSHMKKVELSLRELEAGRPYIVYADVDVGFRKTLDPSFIINFSEFPISMRSIGTSPETSFFIMRNENNVIAFLRAWLEMGMPAGSTDEISFNDLLKRNRWFREMIIPIGNHYISSPLGGGEGIIGRHFYYTSRGRSLAQVREYKKMFFK